MARSSSQSPRALRSSTNDPEAHAKGKVQLGQEEPKATPWEKGELPENLYSSPRRK